MEETTKDWADYIGALRRRRVSILITAGVLFGISVIFAVFWPPVYRSTATILIEEQEIPPELVRSTITTYAWQRIQTISQRVMTRATLLTVMDKYGLYADKRRSKTTEEVLEDMRADIKLDPISADVIDPRSGRPMPATIAFTLSYENRNAQTAQRVANELTTLYLNENLKTRTERADETYTFLSDEANRLSTHIAELESKLAQFKEKNVDRLPEMANLNMQFVDRTERELLDTQTQVRSLEERKFYLEGQLGQMSPSSPMYAPTGERVLDPATRLKTLKTELASTAAKYSPRHPDVIRLELEIEGLEKQVGPVSSSQEQARALSKARSELGAAQKQYGENHPDVVNLRQQVEKLETTLPQTKTPETAVFQEKPDNPAYIALQSQLEGVNSELRSLGTKRKELLAKLISYEQRVAVSPQVERAYLELKRDYDNAQLKYRELKAKQMEAQVGQQLEKERKGERFSLIDPPQLPEEPARPNRKAILLLGLLIALAGGFGYLMLAEALDPSIRSARGLSLILETTPLSVIPYAENSVDRAHRKHVRRLAWRSAMAATIALIVVVQFFWIPWDVLWFKGLRVLTGG